MPSICKYISVRIFAAFRIVFGKKSVLMERHHTVSKRYFFNNIRNVLHELRSKGSRREFGNLKPCHATRGNSFQPLRGEVSGKKGSLCVEIFLPKYST